MGKLVPTLLAALTGLVIAGSAAPQNGFTTEGDVTVQGNQARLVSDFSDTPTTNDISKIAFSVPAGMKVADIDTLSAEFNVTDDDCGGGSPRYTIATPSGNIFVHFGPAPSFTGCTPDSWLSTANLVTNTDRRVDAGQVGGSPSMTYSEMLAVAGGLAVTRIEFNVDGGWFFADKEQTVLVRKVAFDGVTFFPTAGQQLGRNKITICHHARHTQTGNVKHVTIRISQAAWDAHEDHGDTMGPCTSPSSQRIHKGKAHAAKFHRPARGRRP